MPYGFNDDKSKNDMTALFKTGSTKAESVSVPANSTGTDLTFNVDVPSGYKFVGVIGYQLATYNFNVVNVNKRTNTTARMRVSSKASSAMNSGETLIFCLFVREDYY